MSQSTQNIRNFVITAHIDHGKSTLADRLLEATGTVEKRLMKPQYLDQLELERERGITIKMAPVRMKYAPRKNADSAQNNAENGLLYEDITYKIRGAAFEVRKRLGLGHKENVYHNALAQEFSKNGLQFESEKSIGVFYDGKKVGSYKPDFIIENKIIIELKALPEIGRPQTEQLWSYLKGSDYKLSLLINFSSKDLQIKRVVYDSARFLRDSASIQRDSAQVEEYILNLIDTPGHSDFSYEVSRALAAVEGAVLLVDATQGIQAQTLANFESAKKAKLKIIGAVNKVDVAQPEQIQDAVLDLAELIGVGPDEILKVSGKTGEGVEALLAAIINKVPPPKTNYDNNNNDDKNSHSHGYSRALIFDSLYDEHKGVMAFVRVFDGEFQTNDDIELLATKTQAKAKEIGYFTPQLKPSAGLKTGEIGYIATGIKDPNKLKIGDTVCGPRTYAEQTRTNAEKNSAKSALSQRESARIALSGYAEPKPVVFVSFYPEESDQYDEFKQALLKLKLTDSSLTFEPESSEVLGRGFKGGFLGRLHFEIAAERLSREFNIETVHSFPSVAYRVRLREHAQTSAEQTQTNAEKTSAKSASSQRESAGFVLITNPKDFPNDYLEVQEPMTKTEIVTPPQFLGSIMRLREVFRFSDMQTETLKNKVIVRAKLPLADLIRDLDDRLKSVSQGFASFYYELTGFEKADVAKLEILVANHTVPGLTRILPKNDIEREARVTCEKLKDLLPKQQFTQAIQAVVGGKIIARETIPAMKKLLGNFGKTGGDRTRKMKLWKKQQRGKERLKERGESTQIKIPANIFKELLKK